MSVDNEAKATTALQRIKRGLPDPFDYMAKAKKPSKQSVSLSKQNKSKKDVAK